jgi:hypothetical protein
MSFEAESNSELTDFRCKAKYTNKRFCRTPGPAYLVVLPVLVIFCPYNKRKCESEWEVCNVRKRMSARSYGQPLEFRPHSYFVDFTSLALFYIMTSLPAFIKVGKTPVTQNLVFEQYVVKIGNSMLFLYDRILIYHDCDFKKMRIQKLLTNLI